MPDAPASAPAAPAAAPPSGGAAPLAPIPPVQATPPKASKPPARESAYDELDRLDREESKPKPAPKKEGKESPPTKKDSTQSSSAQNAGKSDTPTEEQPEGDSKEQSAQPATTEGKPPLKINELRTAYENLKKEHSRLKAEAEKAAAAEKAEAVAVAAKPAYPTLKIKTRLEARWSQVEQATGQPYFGERDDQVGGDGFALRRARFHMLGALNPDIGYTVVFSSDWGAANPTLLVGQMEWNGWKDAKLSNPTAPERYVAASHKSYYYPTMDILADVNGSGDDNTDPLWIARTNVGVNQSELRVNIGDDFGPTAGATADAFVVGVTYYLDQLWKPVLSVFSTGNVGIGTTAPATALEVNGTVTATGFSGNGAGLTGVNAVTLGGSSSANFWKSTGNAGTTPGANFIGTTDNQPLEFKVNGTRALRLEPNGVGAPNLIGGAPNNVVGAGTLGATIGGGSFNTAAGDNTVVGGGFHNTSADGSTVSGGDYNTAAGGGSTVGGGSHNNALSPYSTVSGGHENASGPYASVPGGDLNSAGGAFSFAAGPFVYYGHEKLWEHYASSPQLPASGGLSIRES